MENLKNVVKIKLIFENGDTASINAEDIDIMEISGIYEIIKKAPFENKPISKITVASKIMFVFNSEANKTFAWSEKPGYNRFHSFEMSLFDRISWFNDIVNIILFYDDDTIDLYYTEYEPLDYNNMVGSPNIKQCSIPNKRNKKLMIIIAKDKSFAARAEGYFEGS